ncbi:hypothetical protein PMAYCL1PPCAC_04774, partial [Pristionchus mayeri]
SPSCPTSPSSSSRGLVAEELERDLLPPLQHSRHLIGQEAHQHESGGEDKGRVGNQAIDEGTPQFEMMMESVLDSANESVCAASN